MIYHGHIENGRLVLDGEAILPEGARLRIDVIGDSVVEPSLEACRERLNQLRRTVTSLPVRNPADGFSNRDHDDVLYGRQS